MPAPVATRPQLRLQVTTPVAPVPTATPVVPLANQAPELPIAAIPGMRSRALRGEVEAITDGLTSLRVTDLTARVPNIAVPYAPRSPPVPSTVPTVTLPTLNTIVTPVTTPPRRPVRVVPLEPEPVVEVDPRLVQVLNTINPNMLKEGRTGRNKGAYSNIAIRNFARDLDIVITGKKKGQLIEEILALRTAAGLPNPPRT